MSGMFSPVARHNGPISRSFESCGMREPEVLPIDLVGEYVIFIDGVFYETGSMVRFV